MTNPNFFEKFVSSILTSIKATVNQFALNRLQETGRFNPDDAYYALQERGGTLDEYVSSTFFGNLFSRKSWLS
jgi:hypothetical protein